MDLTSFLTQHSGKRIVIEAGDAWHSVEIGEENTVSVENGDTLSDIGLHIEDLEELGVEERADLRDALGGTVEAAYKMSAGDE